jgi:predicted TIM-barrel fold metal-dependent hydrolase
MDTSTIPLISADSHVNEPRFLWYDNLPASMRERAPKGLRPTDDGGWERFDHEGDSETARLRARAEEASRLAQLDADARLEKLDEDGISGEIIFGAIGMYVWTNTDAELEAACCEIYNDWIHETIETHSPRFRCAGVVPTADVGNALTELERIKSRGLAAAMMPMVAPADYNHPQWEPLWEAIEASGLPVVMHQGTGHDMIFYRGRGASVANLLATQSLAPRTAGLLATSGVLEDHPDLHFVFVETNAGWISWAMDTLDFYTDAFSNYIDDKGRNWVRPKLEARPSHYIARQVHGTFQYDPTGVANIDRTGVDALMWGSDYPHEEGTYPHSREWVQKLLGGLEPDQAARIAGGTAASMFGFDDEVLVAV